MEDRVNLAIMAAMLVPRVMAGRIRFFQLPAPVVGSQRSFTEKSIISKNPIQKFGREIPETATVIPVKSCHFPRFFPDHTPRIMPRAELQARLAMVKAMVLPYLAATSSKTGRFVRRDIPRSPFSRPPTYFKYWTGTGLSSPNWTRTASTASKVACSPATSLAGSPGIIRTKKNTKVTTIIRVGITPTIRFTVYRNIAFLISLTTAKLVAETMGGNPTLVLQH